MAESQRSAQGRRPCFVAMADRSVDRSVGLLIVAMAVWCMTERREPAGKEENKGSLTDVRIFNEKHAF